MLKRLVGNKPAISSAKPQTTRFRLLGIVNLSYQLAAMIS